MLKERKGFYSVACISLSIIAIIFLLAIACKFERTYLRKGCEVVNVTQDSITVKDTTNNLWSFKGQDFTVGDIITLEMDTNRTDNIITDDKIIKVVKE